MIQRVFAHLQVPTRNPLKEKGWLDKIEGIEAFDLQVRPRRRHQPRIDES